MAEDEDDFKVTQCRIHVITIHTCDAVLANTVLYFPTTDATL